MVPRPGKQAVHDGTNFQHFVEEFHTSLRQTLAEAIQQGVQQGVQAALAANNNTNQARHVAPRHNNSDESDNDFDHEGNPFGEEINVNRNRQLRVREERDHQDNNSRWELGFKVEIPEFNGGSQPEDFLDWVVAVDEFLDFKSVPETSEFL